jgi:hypothetical protein
LTGVGAGASAWYGVTFLPRAAGSSLTHAVINETVYGVWYQATGANTISFLTISSSTNGVYVTDGTPTFDGVSVTGTPSDST